MKIAIVNQSTSISDLNFHCMVAAARDQVDNEFMAAWGSELGPVELYIYNDVDDVPDGYWVYTVVDDPDEVSYFGYHVNDTPVSQAILFASTIIDYGCPILYDSGDPTFFTVSSMFCHELLEMIVDPYVVEWWDGPGLSTPEGFYPIVSYAAEVCDPVYFDVYTKTITGDIGMSSPLSSPVSVNVCNFICPLWADYYADSSSQFDQMGLLTAPFSMDYGGYMLIRNAEYDTEQYVYGARFPPQFKKIVKAHSRTASRMNGVPRSVFRPANGIPRNIGKPSDKTG